MVEYIAEIDWNDQVIRRRTRDELREEPFIHRISLIIPRTRDNQLILARRANTKEPFPNVLCCAAGGRVRYDETYEQAALRELEEETGITAKLHSLVQTRMNHEQERALYRIFITDPVDPAHFRPDPREVASFCALTFENIQRTIAQNPAEYAPAFRRAFTALELTYRKFIERR